MIELVKHLALNMNKYFFSLLSIGLLSFTTLLSAQAFGPMTPFDDAYLATLPESVREQMMGNAAQADEETDYSNPNTRTEKLESALENAEATLAQIKEDMKKNSTSNRTLKRFGEDFFSSIQSTFLPITEPNPGASYTLDQGDELTIQTVGGMQPSTSRIRIRRDGSIHIDNVGKITVAGLSLEKATDLLKNRIETASIGVQAFISLSDIRELNALIIGDVTNPGMYVLPGGSTPLSLIHVAGGINSVGSYRKISHKRENKLIQTIDLYDVLLMGDTQFKHPLRSGDVLIVHPMLANVKVSGDISNPAIYELDTEKEGVAEIMKYVGLRGGSSATDKELVISGIRDNKIFHQQGKYSEVLQTKLKDGDSIGVLGYEPNLESLHTIVINGEVNKPGSYLVKDGYTLSQIIKMAGGYTEEAYPLGGVLTNYQARVQELSSRQKSYNELVNFLLTNSTSKPKSFNTSDIMELLSSLERYEPSGRVVTTFNLSEIDSDPSSDRKLEDKDSIFIPKFKKEVYVFGEVLSPGSVPYKENFSVTDFINSSGSFARHADKKHLVVIGPDGRSSGVRSTLFDRNLEVLPGSVIYVPRKLGKLNGLDFATGIAPVVSSLALTAASLNSLNN